MSAERENGADDEGDAPSDGEGNGPPDGPAAGSHDASTAPDDGNRWKGWLLTGLQYGLGVAALAWVFAGVDWSRLSTLLVALDSLTVALAVLVTILGLFMRFATWKVLVDRVAPVSLFEAGRIDLSVFFINQLFPSRLSGRSAAPLIIRQRVGMNWSDAVAITGVHTGLYALLYGAVAILGIGLAWTRLSTGVLAVVALSAVLYLVTGTLVLLAGVNMRAIERLVGVVEWVAERLPAGKEALTSAAAKLPGFAADSAARFRSLVAHPGTVAGYTAGWVGVMLLSPAVRVGLLFSGFGSGFEPVVLLPVYLLMAYSVTLLPLTPGGIGVSEATATLVFVSLGLPVDIVAPVVFLDRLLGVYLPALVGAVPVTRMKIPGIGS